MLSSGACLQAAMSDCKLAWTSVPLSRVPFACNWTAHRQDQRHQALGLVCVCGCWGDMVENSGCLMSSPIPTMPGYRASNVHYLFVHRRSGFRVGHRRGQIEHRLHMLHKPWPTIASLRPHLRLQCSISVAGRSIGLSACRDLNVPVGGKTRKIQETKATIFLTSISLRPYGKY